MSDGSLAGTSRLGKRKANGDDEEDDEGEVVLIDSEAVHDTRPFAERVHDMVSAESAGGTVRWEGCDGLAFAIQRDSTILPAILQKHFGNGDVTWFENRLVKYGWEQCRSTSPETHVAYYHSCFCKDKSKTKLDSIKRVRKMLTPQKRKAASRMSADSNDDGRTQRREKNPQEGFSDEEQNNTDIAQGRSASRNLFLLDGYDDNDSEIELVKVVPPSQRPQVEEPMTARANDDDGDDDSNNHNKNSQNNNLPTNEKSPTSDFAAITSAAGAADGSDDAGEESIPAPATEAYRVEAEASNFSSSRSTPINANQATREDELNQDHSSSSGEDLDICEDLDSLVSRTYRATENELRSSRSELVAKYLREKRDNVINEARRKQQSNPTIFRKRLDSVEILGSSATTHRTREKSVFTMTDRKGKEAREIVHHVNLKGADDPQPRHNSPASIDVLYSVDDEEELGFVPYFRDDGNEPEEQLAELFDTVEREKRLERGAVFQEEQVNTEIDLTLRSILKTLRRSGQNDNEKLLDTVAQSMLSNRAVRNKINKKWLLERIQKVHQEVSGAVVEQPQPKVDAKVDDESQYLHLMSDYRDLFCNRCFIYDCNLHGQFEKPSLRVQSQRGFQRARDGYWKDAEFETSVVLRPRSGLTPTNRKLKVSQEILCKKLFFIFEGDLTKVASAMRAPIYDISSVVASTTMTPPEQKETPSLPQPKKTTYYSMSNYKDKWLKRIEQAKSHPFFTPCNHSEPCSDESCLCVQSAFFCTKVCAHAEYSPNFFRGCDCKGTCSQKSCSCYAANRECDPDLCKSCSACTDSTRSHGRLRQKCQNDSITMKRHQRLLVAKSIVPDGGWGLFTKYALKRGDFVHEYVGELISQDEADRRFLLYDKIGYNYLFDHSTEYVIDGMNKGSKARFANHSNHPNVEAKVLKVNGETRIGFFSLENIEAQSELFVDYNFNTYKGCFIDKLGE